MDEIASIWRLACRPESENPTLHEIETRQDAERAQKVAEEAAMATQYLAKETLEKADQAHEEAKLRQEAADRVTAQAAEVMAQIKLQMEEAENVARHAQQLAKAASAARETAERLARESRDEQERAQKMEEDAERAMGTAKGEAEEARLIAVEQRREADAAKARAEEMALAAQIANRAKKDAEMRLNEGIQPIVMPSIHELAEAKKRVQYREDCFHIAIAGVPGSGKSSLVNALRGLRSRDVGAATIGFTERMLQTTRYHDTNPDNPYVWYDLPGVRFKCWDWQYFNDQNLYVFDCIILLFDNRFTATDVAILTNARRFKIPTYIIRSKADHCIRNVMTEIDSEEEVENVEHHRKLHDVAEKKFIHMTRECVRNNLKSADLPDQRVYIVSSFALLKIVLNKMPKNTIDELEFLNDFANETRARRKARPTSEMRSQTTVATKVVSRGLPGTAAAKVTLELQLIDGLIDVATVT